MSFTYVCELTQEEMDALFRGEPVMFEADGEDDGTEIRIQMKEGVIND